MLDRALIIDANFTERVSQNNFPKALSQVDAKQFPFSREQFLELFKAQITSRHIDLKARELKQKNLGFYSIGSSGHEGNAAIAHAFNISDYALLHYRSGAFVIARAQLAKQKNIIEEQLLSLVASEKDPISQGRHKVFGSVSLNIPPQTSTIASHLPKAVGLAFSITRAKELAIKNKIDNNSVVLCGFGDASINHSVALGAFNTAEWIAHSSYPIPLVFICEDNGIGISVPTPSDWIHTQFQHRKYLQYISCDGLNLVDVYLKAKQAEYLARMKKVPVFLHMKCVRLMGHAGSDIESQYHPIEKIEQDEANDPLLHSARVCLENKFLKREEILKLYEDIRKKVNEASMKALKQPKLHSKKAIMASLIPKQSKMSLKRKVLMAERKKVFAENYVQLSQKRNLCQLINLALTDLMMAYPNILVFGEDVAKKGGVYRVTAELIQRFGQRRVFDTLLDETTILGHAIGLSMNGFLPIPEIQFLAYYHNAEDQIRGEAATLSFFSSGQYSNPMIVRIPGLAYQKGFGGHFHNDNSFAVLRDIPGIIIACPSHGGDAVKMLRTCVDLALRERRIIIFVEPIALYMTKDLHQEGDNLWLDVYPEINEKISLGEFAVFGASKKHVVITYGNGYFIARQAEKILREKHKIKIKIIDLRWLKPLNINGIIKEIKDCKNILIVDEERMTGSLSEELITSFVEKLKPLPNIKRITGADSFIPLGKAWKYVLPSKEDVVKEILQFENKKH